ncbi:MAG: hypothetical protein A2341_04820 [Deltaproteobacteria bacterium RIFOXYB12_FULL_58_9]|nr:MAG: hypothetical protein A2341_04820 [Deltaproteobacteria bacterium RIFOXYB12_FULL_58_9]
MAPMVFPNVANAATELETALAGLPQPFRAELSRRADQMLAQNIPTDVLAKKLNEGTAKHIPAARIAQTLMTMADNLEWAAELTANCVAARDPISRARILETSAAVLFGPITREDMTPALRDICDDVAGAKRFASIVELHSFLVHNLHATTTHAWPFALAALERHETEGAVSRVVAVFQRIFRENRSVDRPLSIATLRLRDKIPLRTISNELEDQFLRR